MPIPWLLAVAEAIPAVAKIVDAVQQKDAKANTAAQVATDPNAPPAVKQAAANVAAQAIDERGAAEKAALQAATGKPAATGGSSTAYLVLGGIALLALSRRR